VTPTSLYIHIPFCRHRCGYCDFNTYAGLEDLIEPYVQAVSAEITLSGQLWHQRPGVHTIYFGGGTPSLLSVSQVDKILETIGQSFSLVSPVEITLEANPGTLTRAYLNNLASLGINRLSLGVQSANSNELRLLERQHNFTDVLQSITWARQAGFFNLNLDLIFGLPEQEMATWKRTLLLATDLMPEHLSLYALTIEQNTPFGHWIERGVLSQPDNDQAADMYEWAMECLEAKGWNQYEISNWARSDAQGNSFSCQHNLQYWRNFSYLGFGAGAHGYARNIRTENVLSPAVYIKRFKDLPSSNNLVFPGTPATKSLTPVDRATEIAETMMMGLRLVEEGVSDRAFMTRFNSTLDDVFHEAITRLSVQGLLEWRQAGQRRSLCLTHRGRLLGNRVFIEFI
jgi:oxygen-independent coproporphyrinogen III oxidase